MCGNYYTGPVTFYVVQGIEGYIHRASEEGCVKLTVFKEFFLQYWVLAGYEECGA